MGTLLWLATIYQLDMNTYQWETGTRYDFKKLAQEIVRDDPCCGPGPPGAATPISPPSGPAAGLLEGPPVHAHAP